MNYTVLIHDYSEHDSDPRIRVVQTIGTSPEDAASNAEVEVASTIWETKHRNPKEDTHA